jgi:hypothetical protein
MNGAAGPGVATTAARADHVHPSDTSRIRNSGLQVFTQEAGTSIGTAGQVNTFQVLQPTAQSDAFVTFHIAGDFAAHLGFDGTTNDLTVGGWSFGTAKYRVWHQGNDGAGSGMDADLLDGKDGSYYGVARLG